MRILRAGIAASLVLAGTTIAPTDVARADDDPSPRLTYGQPAALNRWQEESLPIGNGAMGASIFGQVAHDEVTLNEKTLWTGGPGVDGYRFGNHPAGDTARRHANLQTVRDEINAKGSMDPARVAQLLGQPKVGYGNYQSFGKLAFDFPGGDATDAYERRLDLQRATAEVEYRQGDTTYRREYFASRPDAVVVMRISADKPGKVSMTATYDRNASASAPKDQQGLAQARIDAGADGRISVHGALADNGLRYHAETLVDADGGRVAAADEGVEVTGADSVTIIWSAATDYELAYPHYRTGESSEQLDARVSKRVDTAAAAGFDALRARHEADHRALFDRVRLDLGGAPETRHADVARAQYRGDNPALEELYYQYGRYLLIASSREGSLPANLQGVWSNRNDPPWSADYHTNINLQMNYWPAMSANLRPTLEPYRRYVADLARAGADSARNVFGHGGWMVMNETTPFGFTGVFDWPTAFWFPEANAWLTQALVQEWLYTGDDTFLRDEVWPVLRGAAEFWANYLVTDPRDGTLVANPSYSPEHGPFVAGAAMSQQIATEVLDSAVTAAKTLGLRDDEARFQQVLDKVDPGLHVVDGKIQEWKTPGIAGEPNHRHVSHLYALFPGRTISPERTPELADAARAALEERGDGGTGWSMAWKVNFWAHLRDGDHAHRMLANLLTASTYPNLWDAHPPFQIDGNFGGVSGVNEMLVQNEPDHVRVLPALPTAWAKRGSVDGIRAHGGLTVGADWSVGAATEVRVERDRTGVARIATSLAHAMPVVRDARGAEVRASVQGDVVEFPVRAGEQYTVTGTQSVGFAWTPEFVTLGSEATLDVAVSTTSPGTVRLDVPEGWTATSPTTVDVAPPTAAPVRARSAAARADQVQTVRFTVQSPTSGSEGRFVATLVTPGDELRAATTLRLVDPTVVTEGAVVAWSSQEPTGEGPPQGLAASAFDGELSTFWHSRWSTGTDPQPHSIVIDVRAPIQLDRVLYWPRQGTPANAAHYNGTLSKLRVEVATEGDFTIPTADEQAGTRRDEPQGVQWQQVAETTVELGKAGAPIMFEPTRARYVRITALEGVNGFSNAAEFGLRSATPLFETPTPPPLPEPSPEPSSSPSAEPSAGPSVEPSVEPSGEPSHEPGVGPTQAPTVGSPAEPTSAPTEEPTDELARRPKPAPTAEPAGAAAPATPGASRPGLPATGR